MDLGGLAVLIPILALSIPVVALVFNGVHKTMRLRIEETRARSAATPGGAEVAMLAEEVERLRRDLGEVEERLDFAERMLAQGRDRHALPPRA